MTIHIGITLTLVAALAVAAPARAQQQDDDRSMFATCQPVDGRLPANVQVTPSLLPRVQMMLQRSDDFRRQCQELAAHPTVYVRVSIAPTLTEMPSRFCARSTIQRMSDGPLLIFVELGRTVDWSEWIAHEFEHVLEQAEGLRASDLRKQKAWETAESVFETERAIGAGRAVREQMRRKPAAALAANN